MTSVKEFRVGSPPTDDEAGTGRFVFTDAYSVFDWGRMPDEIPGKGASLCTMGAYNFELLENEGVPTHYRGVVAGDEVGPLATADDPPTEMAIELAQVPDLPHDGDGYDYDAFHEAAGDNYVVPLEIVFRNVVGEASSIRNRTSPEDVGLDAASWPEGTVTLPEPVVEFSTKYESQDRYLSHDEVDAIAGKADVDGLESLAREVNRIVTARAEEAGFVHEDGKIECVYRNGDLLVADVVGTFDENRFSYDGQEVSKEVVRQYYRREHPEWVDAVYDAKAAAREAGSPDWRERCSVDPEPLPESVVSAVADLYTAGADAYTGEEWFDGPTIAEAVAAVRDLY
jgi:phosphoribosylaminoimidazole-succinocarboxamide synthase